MQCFSGQYIIGLPVYHCTWPNRSCIKKEKHPVKIQNFVCLVVSQLFSAWLRFSIKAKTADNNKKIDTVLKRSLTTRQSDSNAVTITTPSQSTPKKRALIGQPASPFPPSYWSAGRRRAACAGSPLLVSPRQNAPKVRQCRPNRQVGMSEI